MHPLWSRRTCGGIALVALLVLNGAILWNISTRPAPGEVEEFIRLVQFQETILQRANRLACWHLPWLRSHLPPLPTGSADLEEEKRLESMGAQIIPELAAALNHPEPYVRFRLLRLLQRFGLHQPEVLRAFELALEDGDPQLRRFALVNLLGFLGEGGGGEEFFRALEGHLQDQSPQVISLARWVGVRQGYQPSGPAGEALLIPELAGAWLEYLAERAAGPLMELDGELRPLNQPEFWLMLLQGDRDLRPPSWGFQFNFMIPRRGLPPFGASSRVGIPMSTRRPSIDGGMLPTLVSLFWQVHPDLQPPLNARLPAEGERRSWRVHAAHIASRLGASPEVLEAELRSALRSGDLQLQEWTVEFLSDAPGISDFFLEELMDWTLHEPEYQIRVAAVAALGQVGRGDPRVLETVTRALADDWVFVRAAAVEALGRLGKADEATVGPLLLEALQSPMGLVRVTAAGVLADWGYRPPQLTAVLQQTREHKLESVRSRAVRVLDQLASEAMLPPSEPGDGTESPSQKPKQ